MSTNDDLPPLSDFNTTQFWLEVMAVASAKNAPTTAQEVDRLDGELHRLMQAYARAALADARARRLRGCLCDPHVEHCSVCLPSAWTQVPEGWQLVPKIPTWKMIDAGCPVGEVFDHFDVPRVYGEMLAAAPLPKEQT